MNTAEIAMGRARETLWGRPWLVLAIASMALHLICNGRYGFFRDELYFIVCGSRPAWGYVDQPPLVPILAYGAHWLLGDWLLGFRLIPALAMSVTVALTAEFAKEIGGGRFAQWLGGCARWAQPSFWRTACFSPPICSKR